MSPSDASQLIAIAVVEHEDRFLVGVRPPDVPLAGYAEFPGGKVTATETAQDAAVRECHEETQLTVEVVATLHETLHQYDHGTLRLMFFRCRPIDAGQSPAAPFRWVDRSELAKLTFPEANVPLIARLSKRN